MNKSYITTILAVTSLAFSASALAQSMSESDYKATEKSIKTEAELKYGILVAKNVDQEVDNSKGSAITKKLPNIKSNVKTMEERWVSIQETIFPEALVRLCRKFKQDYPGSQYTPDVDKTLKGAKRALRSQRIAELTDDTLDAEYGEIYLRNDLAKALRGDKDAAYRVALIYQKGGNGIPKNARRAEQWLKFSAELGNGVASWKLAKIYLETGQEADAAKYENRAIKLGYVPPPRLSNRNY